MFGDWTSVQWILAVLLGIMGWWLRNQDRRITALEEKGSDHVQRLTTLEAHYIDILNRLGRIETKLDDLKH